MLDLFLFTVNRRLVSACDRGGVSGFVIDWEYTGKPSRQSGFNTQINRHSHDDLSRVREWTNKRLLVRIDRFPTGSLRLDQIRIAAERGADEVLLPMVRCAHDVKRALTLSHSLGIDCGCLVETREAVDCRRALASLPLSRVYIGLNDLAIDHGYDDLFEPFRNGLIEELRSTFRVPFGVAGITVPDRGTPLSANALMGRLLELGCEFTFLRRTFLADIANLDPATAVSDIRQTAARVRADDGLRMQLVAALRAELAANRIPVSLPPPRLAELV